MTIRVECDQCFKTYNVPDERLGQRIKCKACGNGMRVGEEEVAEVPVALPPRSRRTMESGGRAKVASSVQSRKLVPFIVGGIAFLLVAIGGFIIVKLIIGNGGDIAENSGAVAASSSDDAANSSSLTAQGEISGPTTPNATTPLSLAPKANVVADNSAVVPSPMPANPPSPITTPPASAPTSTQLDAKVVWNLNIDPSRNEIVWPAKLSGDMKYEGDVDGLMYPSIPSSCAIVGIYAGNLEKAFVYDFATAKSLGSFPAKPGSHTNRALSPDGRYVAVSLLQKRGDIEIWQPGQSAPLNVVHVAENEDQVSYIAFRSPNEIVTVGYTKEGTNILKQMRVTNVETGKEVSRIITKKDMDFRNNAFSPGGKYFFSLDTANTVTAYDLDVGTCVGEISLRTSSESSNPLAVGSLAVTEDGTQLCIVQTSPWETLISFHDIKTGKQTDTITLAGNLTHIANNHGRYQGNPIQFMRGGQYILLDGQLLVHKKTKRVVWLLTIVPTEDQFQLTNNSERRVAGDMLIVTDGPRNFPELRDLQIPFGEIESALEVVAANGPATVGPKNAEVALDIDVSTVRFGSVEETKKELSSTLTDRLSVEGLKVVEGVPAVLSLQYAEGAGNTLSLSKFQPGVPRSQQTQQTGGPSVESTKAMMQLELKVNNKAVWSKVIELDPRVMIIRGDANAQSVRDNVFEHVQQSLYGIPVVWYVSQEKPYVTLPILESFQCQATVIGGRRPTKRPGSR